MCDILPLVHSALNPCKLIDSNSEEQQKYEEQQKNNVKILKFNK